MIEPYVGSTSRNANILEITALQKVTDYDASIDAAGWARGEKVWFREMTGIKPLTIAQVVSPMLRRGGRERHIRVDNAGHVNDRAASTAGYCADRRQGIEQIVSVGGHRHRSGAAMFPLTFVAANSSPCWGRRDPARARSST